MQRETHARSVLKAISWKLLASTMAFALSWWITGNISTATKTAAALFVLGLVAYYLHERLWDHIRWGKESK